MVVVGGDGGSVVDVGVDIADSVGVGVVVVGGDVVYDAVAVVVVVVVVVVGCGGVGGDGGVVLVGC